MDPLHIVAIWLHTLAFVIAWGYYGILGRMILPALERSVDRGEQGAALAAIERRALPLILLSLVLFAATGAWLLLVDPRYEGLGNVFASTWTTLMFVKHLLVVGLVAAGAAVDVQARRVSEASSEPARASARRRLALSAEAATGLGAIIALMTAAAQAAA